MAHQIKLSIPNGPFARKLYDWMGRWATSEQHASGLVLDGGVPLSEDETSAMLRELLSLFAKEGVDLRPHLDRLAREDHAHDHKQPLLSNHSVLEALLQVGLPMLSRGGSLDPSTNAGKHLADVVARAAGAAR